jgi:hypothetical protein
MKTRFAEIRHLPRSAAMPEQINAFVRSSFTRMAGAETVPPMTYRFRYGVCQSLEAEILFDSPEQALATAEAKKWFGRLVIENGRTTFFVNTLNDAVDFGKEQ